MPMWRCPHCGTPQAETARCWVCHRSSTACGTCRHYRRSVAAQLGYCGLDRKRQPLTGEEIRGCWEAWPAGTTRLDVTPTIGPAGPLGDGHRHLEFVEVREGAVTSADSGSISDVPVVIEAEPALPPRSMRSSATPLTSGAEPGWSLWGDLDR